ncbi:MAG TPA: hypothetical protein VLG46_16350, partial [Anaerolineae bacterium]|nr:hypothetical protein [Anaerolineae bacterium]
YDIGPRLSPSARFGMRLNGRRVGVALLDTSLLLLVVITIGVWISGAAIGERGRRWLRLGGMLLAGSIVVLAISLFLFVFGAALLPQAWLADLSAETNDLVRGVMQAFVQQLALRSIVAGALLLFGALGLSALGLLRKHQ